MELHNENRGRHLAHWPQILFDTVSRMEGLILLSGTRHSQVLHIERILRELHPGKKIVNTDQLSRQNRTKDIDDGDIIIFQGVCDFENMLSLVDLAEEGRLVIQIVMAPTVISSLHKVMTALAEDAKDHALWRYVDQLSLVMTQMPMSDVNGENIFIHEVVLGTPHVKGLILQNELQQIEALLKSHLENQGVLSFNQSLMKLLIRRKIDMKTAFLKTRDPGNLDDLLKKVGI